MTEQTTYQTCDNCFKMFPDTKIATHFGYCRRNIKKCQTCGQMYDINFKQDHQQQFHKLSSCKYCAKQFKPNEVQKHEQNCQSKTKYCEYCQLNVPLKNYNAHLKDCEARTKTCQNCRKPIANKDWLAHPFSCPGFVQQIKPRNQNYNSLEQYMRNPVKKQQKYQRVQEQNRRELQKNQYKPAYQQLNRQRPVYKVQSRDKKAQYLNPSSNSNKQASINQAKIINPSSQPNRLNRDANSNKYGPTYVNNGDKKVTTQVYERQKNSVAGLGSNKNIPDNKYGPTIKNNTNNPQIYANSNSNPQSIGNKIAFNHRNQAPTNSNNTRAPYNFQPSHNINQPTSKYSFQPASKNINQPYNPSSQYSNNQVSSKNYPRVNQNYRKQVPREKQKFIKKQVPHKQEKPKRQTRSTRNNPNFQYVPDHFEQQSESYYPPQYGYQNNFSANYMGDNQQDAELQKAIMASIGAVGSQNSSKNPKPSIKLDDFPADMLQNDMMNQSFYDKQMAIMEQFERNKRKR